MVHVNYIAVVVAAFASYIIAAIWYSAIFGKLWQRLTGITDMKVGPFNYILVLIGCFVMSYVLYHSIVFGDAYMQAHGDPVHGIAGGLEGGFFVWIGYVATTSLSIKIFEKKPWGLWLLDNAFWLISIMAMGAIQSCWM